jgi:hypothetical protein
MSFQNSILSGAAIDPTSKFHASAMLPFLIVEITNQEFGVNSNVTTSMPNLNKNPPVDLELKHQNRQTGQQIWAVQRAFTSRASSKNGLRIYKSTHEIKSRKKAWQDSNFLITSYGNKIRGIRLFIQNNTNYGPWNGTIKSL